MKSELSVIFRVNLVVKNLVLGSPGTQILHMSFEKEDYEKDSIKNPLQISKQTKKLLKRVNSYLLLPFHNFYQENDNPQWQQKGVPRNNSYRDAA